MLLSDFHIHSTFSDGKLTIPEIVDLYGKQNFGAIAITDHLCEEKTWLGKAAAYLGRTLTPASFHLYIKILQSEAERAWSQYRMVLLPGFEITKNTILNHRSAHILAIGVTDWISADLGIVETCRKIREKGGLSIAAHPLAPNHLSKHPYWLWDNREELAPEIDAWEITNNRVLLKDVLATRLPKIANSDFHRLEHFSSWKTLIHAEAKQEAILEAVRRQNIEFRYVQSRIHEYPHDDNRAFVFEPRSWLGSFWKRPAPQALSA